MDGCPLAIHSNCPHGVFAEEFSDEVKRYHTFPIFWNFNATRRELAWSGFIYCGTRAYPDQVICVFCGLTLKNFTEDDEVHFMHRMSSPRCPRITGILCENIAFPQDQEMEELSPPPYEMMDTEEDRKAIDMLCESLQCITLGALATMSFFGV